MDNDRIEKYSVRHTTSECSCEKIKANGKFICSKHNSDARANSNQWLGDGIYFWDGNEHDKSALDVEIAVVKKKKENRRSRVAMITFDIRVKASKHMNLTNEDWEEKFIEFLSDSSAYTNGKKLIDLVKMAHVKKNVEPTKLDQIGLLFGTSINFFIEALAKDKGIEIDMVSHHFYHKQRKHYFLGKTEFCLRQFCVKNENIIPSKSKQQWEFEYI